MSEEVKRIVVEKEEQLSTVKKIFDRIWVTFIIVINSVYGLLIGAFTFYALINENYYIEKYVLGFGISVGAIIALNVVNYVTRQYLKKY